MTRVDFYLLQGEAARHPFACRLADKVYGQGRRVYIHTGSDPELRYLDRLLWTFRDQSFVPHGAVGEVDPHYTPVLLGCGEAPESEHDVLINLAPQVPGFFSRFQRLAEIVDGDAVVKQAARTRYRFYKERGYPLETHNLSP